MSAEELIQKATEQYGGGICVDMLDEALQQETMQEAIDVLIVDTIYWDGSYENV